MITFLKLGGSLITDKDQPSTARLDTINALVREIAHARETSANLKLVIGHGSGSFGHIAGKIYGTRQGVKSEEGWQGFVEVWRQARALNQIIVEAFSAMNLPVIAFPPSALIITRRGNQVQWNTQPIRSALQAGLIPLLNGDVVFDDEIGGTILSTEEVFTSLAESLPPNRILLCGSEPGVWSDFPQCKTTVPNLTPSNAAKYFPTLKGSNSVDVTGGMLEKVRLMLNLVCEHPNLQAFIFSGKVPGNLSNALKGQSVGTKISAF